MSFNVNIPDDANKIISLLYNAGGEAYVVGGCVRDSVMNIEPHDWDICTSFDPYKVKAILADNGISTYDTGIKHGTITAHMPNMDIEITTYRIDGKYSDGRRPDSVEFTDSITADLARRDFTMNAIAYNDRVGFVDPYGGLEDIDKRVIKCVGNPSARFNEDGLRILRALRFSVEKQFKINYRTSTEIHSNKGLLLRISGERIQSELCRMLVSENVKYLRTVLLDYSDVICTIIPEFKLMIGFDQNNPHHIYNVWEHTVMTVINVDATKILRLAALFHDCGKPDVYSEDKNGVGHFINHACMSAEICEMVMRRLHFSNADIEAVSTIVLNHDNLPDKASKRTLRRLISRMSFDRVFDIIKLRGADIIGQGTDISRIMCVYRLLNMIEEIKAGENCFTVNDLDISGYDLIEIGLYGKAIGDMYRSLLNAVLDEKVPNSKYHLIEYAKKLSKLESLENNV